MNFFQQLLKDCESQKTLQYIDIYYNTYNTLLYAYNMYNN